MPDSEPTVITRRQGRAGRITLNRPRALNALDHSMIAAMRDALLAWQDDPDVHLVVVDGAGGRAFCAGGDIRTVRDMALAGDWGSISSFFADEYALNLLIARYSKPYVALVDGICMGGGIGVSVHGAARVATDAAVFAMPETGIGFFPDVGMSYVLPRLRGHSGLYLGLTGARVTGAEAVQVGLATHYVTRERLSGLGDELAEHGVSALADAATPLPATTLPSDPGDLRCFGRESVAAILQALDQRGTAWATAATGAMRRASPSAVSWSFELLRRGAARELEACLQAELALSGICTRHPDFAEGVRAMVVDKDRAPRWTPAQIEDVTAEAVAGWRDAVA